MKKPRSLGRERGCRSSMELDRSTDSTGQHALLTMNHPHE